LFPPVPVELLPESETRCFERLSGVPMTFAGDAWGKVTSLVLHYRVSGRKLLFWEAA
jgi:hypothetical protein